MVSVIVMVKAMITVTVDDDCNSDSDDIQSYIKLCHNAVLCSVV